MKKAHAPAYVGTATVLALLLLLAGIFAIPEQKPDPIRDCAIKLRDTGAAQAWCGDIWCRDTGRTVTCEAEGWEIGFDK